MKPQRLLALLVCSTNAPLLAGCAPADSTASGTPGGSDEKLLLGSIPTVVQRLRSENPGHSRRARFPIGVRSEVQVLVQAYDEEDGRVAMSGRAVDSEDSEFILKLSEADVYGWIVYRDRNVAWEISAGNDGDVAAEQVPVEKIFPVCPVPSDDETEPMPVDEPTVVFNAPSGFPGHVGSYPGTDVTKLQSRPGNQKVWYLDFTDTMNGSEPKSGHTKEDVWVSWSIAAAWLYSFDINVTTDPAVYTAAGVTNSGCVTIVHADIGAGSSCALNIFGTRRCCDNHLYRDGYATGRIIDHESGHGLGLAHDGGNPGGEYFNGLSEFQWTPLMGNVWPGDRWQQGLFQLSKGEYTSATQTQDDFAIVDRVLDYVPDDIPDTKPLVLDATSVAAAKNWGQIGRNTDTDSWSFEIGPASGHATLKIDRIEHRGGSMLDVHASIVDSMGATVTQNNAAVARSADLNIDLPAGRYSLLVKGGAEGTPQRGFSGYSSVGLYSISGTITGATAGGTGGMGGMGGSAGRGGGGLGGLGGGSGPGGAGGSGGSSVSGGASGEGGGQAGTTGAGGPGAGSGGLGGAAGSGIAGTGAATAAGSVGWAGTGAGTAGFGGTGTIIDPGAADAADESSGCGCRTAGTTSRRTWEAMLAAGLALAFARRKRAWTIRTSRGST